MSEEESLSETEESEIVCIDSGSEQQQNLLSHPRGKSKCWRFFGFRVDDDGKISDMKQVLCRLCSAGLSYSGNTTNMKYHIQKHHPEHLKDIEEPSKERDANHDTAPSESGFKQLSLQAALNKVKPYSKDSQRYKTMVNAVGEFICYGLQPISVADDPSFRKLMAKSDQKFQLPSRNSSCNTLPVKCKVESELSKSKYCAITRPLDESTSVSFLHKPHCALCYT